MGVLTAVVVEEYNEGISAETAHNVCSLSADGVALVVLGVLMTCNADRLFDMSDRVVSEDSELESNSALA